MSRIWHPSVLKSQQGFVLIVAVMMLFAATIFGMMVINSSDMEILLSGAQQRYEGNMSVSEGGNNLEATAVGTAATIIRGANSRGYSVSDPGSHDQILSPTTPSAAIFDPGNDMDTSLFPEVTLTTAPENWPMDNLLFSDVAADDAFDYQYRTVYLYATSPPKGFDATKFAGYRFQISAHKNSTIEVGGTKVGPK